jgi:hypothetical protein
LETVTKESRELINFRCCIDLLRKQNYFFLSRCLNKNSFAQKVNFALE